MVEGYLKPSLVLRGDLLSGEFFYSIFGPVRWKIEHISTVVQAKLTVSASDCRLLRGRREERERSHVTKSHHADSLPHTQGDTRSNSSVKSLNTVGLINILEGLAHGKLLRAVWIVGLALHLDSNDFNRLIPSGQSTTKTRRADLLDRTQLFFFVLPGGIPNRTLRQARQPKTGTPVGGLTDGDCIDTLIDAADPFFTVDTHECLPGAGRLHTRRRHLVSGNLDSLHAGTEAHGGICLSNTTTHTSSDTSHEV